MATIRHPTATLEHTRFLKRAADYIELRDTLMWLQGQGYPVSHPLPGGWSTGLEPAYELIVLDPFAGSNSTGAAARLEGARFLGIEQDREYVRIARARIKHWATIGRGAARASSGTA